MRAESLAEGELPTNGEQRIIWHPSRYDLAHHPELPEEAQIEGRLLAIREPGFDKSLYLFTTLLEAREKIAAWYAKRWNQELDLRTLKGTMRLHHLRGKSTEAVEKELLIAVAAYGLVRAFMALAARRVGLLPRRLSFTRSYSLLNAMVGSLCIVADTQQRQQAYGRILEYLGKAKLPKRSKPRIYPRAVWGTGKGYPNKGPLSRKEKSK